MSYQLDPKNFMFGTAFREGIQQSQDNKRKNALLDLEKQQFGLNERRVNAEEARLAQSDAERQAQMQAAQRNESIGLRALAAARGDRQSGMAILEELNLPVEFDDEQDWQDFFGGIAEKFGGFEAAKPNAVGQLYKMADGTYAPAERAIGNQFYNEPTAPREGPAPSYRDIIDPTDPKRMITVDGRLYRGGGLGSPGVLGVAGKEPSAAKAEETRGTGKSSVSDIVSNLRDSYNQLHKAGGIVDKDAGVVANVGNYLQSSAPGQFAGRVLGTENQSTRNKIKQARPLLLQAIRQATGMTGKQMDSNVELQLYLSAATDPTLDIDANLEALDNIERLYGLGGAPETSAQPAPAGTTLRFDANGDPL